MSNEEKNARGPAATSNLGAVSVRYDRTGKGYLDDTEQALRKMDSDNKGYLSADKVGMIFEQMKAEQERSSKLLESLQKESKKSLNLRNAVIALTVFLVLLALANIGTSFAVAKLVEDTQVSQQGDLQAKETGLRLGTTSKRIVVVMDPLLEDPEDAAATRSRRRHRRRLDFLSEEPCDDNSPIFGRRCKLSEEKCSEQLELLLSCDGECNIPQQGESPVTHNYQISVRSKTDKTWELTTAFITAGSATKPQTDLLPSSDTTTTTTTTEVTSDRLNLPWTIQSDELIGNQPILMAVVAAKLETGYHCTMNTNKIMKNFDLTALTDGSATTSTSISRSGNLNDAGVECEDAAQEFMGADRVCRLQGTITQTMVDALHQELVAQDEVILDCYGKRSVIQGGANLPEGEPGPHIIGGVEYIMYPSAPLDGADHQNNFYSGKQGVVLLQGANPAKRCTANFGLSIGCHFDLASPFCQVFTSFDPDAAENQGCPKPPVICGNPAITTRSGAMKKTKKDDSQGRSSTDESDIKEEEEAEEGSSSNGCRNSGLPCFPTAQPIAGLTQHPCSECCSGSWSSFSPDSPMALCN